jgi:hypothetical protein
VGFKVKDRFFSEHFVIPLSVTIPPMLHTQLSSRAETTGPFEAAIPRDPVSLHSYN